MGNKVLVPNWTLKDVIFGLIVVLGGSYLIGELLRPFLPAQLPVAVRFFLAGIIQTVLLLGVVFFIVSLKHGISPKRFGLKFNFSNKVISQGILGGIVLFFVVLLSGLVVNVLFPMEAQPQPFADLVLKAETSFELIIPFIMGSILAPIGEEVFFRGFTYPVLRKKFGIISGIMITGIFFAFLHFDLVRFIPLAIGGAGLAWLYEITGTLITPIIAHSVWNTAMLILLIIFANNPIV